MIREKRPKKEPLDVKYNLKVYWSFLRKHKTLFSGLVLTVMCVTLLNFSTRWLFKKVIDESTFFAANQTTQLQFIQILKLIGIIWIIVICINAVFRWVRAHLLMKLETKLILNLKEYYYNHILRLSNKFHTSHKTGSLISRLGRGANSIERLTDFLAYNTLPLLFELVIASIAFMSIDKKIGVIVLIIGTIFIIYNTKIQKKQRAANVEMNEAEDLEKAMTSDTFTNIESIKYYGKEELMGQKYGKLAQETKNRTLKRWGYDRWSSSGENLIIGGGGLIVLFLIIRSFMSGVITLGTVTFIWATYNVLIENVRGFMDGLRGYHRSMADFHDLFQYGKIENEIKDKPGAKELAIKEGNIEFKNISFRYHSQQLFNNLNLVIPKNKKIALVGYSGSGKSTLIKLLYRLYDLDKGQIVIDGTDIKDVKQESLRSELSIVPQDCILFDDTIYNNIKFSRPNANRKEVMQAIKSAQLDKVIENFPYKENTIVGERGVKLSGGEKQRVSIARAILANKKVLVLDEATYSLDSKTEYEIQKDLQNLMKNRTSLIIAHRLSTVMNADQIIVLDKGRIVQQGTHRELINKSGQYKELWTLQKGGYLGE